MTRNDWLAIACVTAMAPVVWMGAGCTGCGPFTSTSTTENTGVMLDAGAGPRTYKLEVSAAKQDCGFGCTWCGDPRVTVTLSGEVSWLNPSDTSSIPVVRVTLKPLDPLFTPDTFEPASPVDVAIVPMTATTAKLAVEFSYQCPTTDGCVVDYSLSVERVEANQTGEVSVAIHTDATYLSKASDAVSVTVDPGGPGS